jgi:hypothetical protein
MGSNASGQIEITAENTKGVVMVAQGHIEKGIAKYQGVIDAQLTSLIKSAGLQYTPYQFNDGRILLVMPNDLGGLLYDSREAMFAAQSLTS